MPEPTLGAILDALCSDAALWRDFLSLCDCGGRRAGTPSEERAIAFLTQRLHAIRPGLAQMQTVPYAGWRAEVAYMRLARSGKALACNPLLGSSATPAGGLEAEVIDLGRGSLDDFTAQADRIAGRAVLVRHEYPFSPQHIHRRKKYGWAFERNAAAFIIANPIADGGPVSGSSGRAGAAGIPAVATDAASAQALAQPGARVRIDLAVEDYAAETSIGIVDIAGASADCVVLSAHLDGHDLAESAMDNASGVAVALAVTRALAPHIGRCRRSLRLCLFSAEEWALAGSKAYLADMSDAQRKRIALNVNLDTVGGDTTLTALTSEFAGLEPVVHDVAAAVGTTIGIYRPTMANSDHYNFAQRGIPALRLIAGFDRPQSNVRHILTGADTRDKVALEELTHAARVTAALVWQALTADQDAATRWR